MKLKLVALLIASSAIAYGQELKVKYQTLTIHSKLLKEDKKLHIWVPTDSKPEDQLPTLYMVDGGLTEDFPMVSETLERLISEKKITPMRLIGIENGNRKRDLTSVSTQKFDKKIAPQNGGADVYRLFIQTEVFPKIENTFSCAFQRSFIGESLAGLFVMETFFLNPDLFENYIAFDPSLWWNDGALIKTAPFNIERQATTKKRVWFAASNSMDIYKNTQKLTAVFIDKKYPGNQWLYKEFPNLTHATIYKAQIENALIWMFGL